MHTSAPCFPLRRAGKLLSRKAEAKWCSERLVHKACTSNLTTQGLPVCEQVLEVLQNRCAADGLPVGVLILVSQAYADDTIGGATTPAGLQRIISIAKQFGDEWGCVLNVSKSAVMLVGSEAALATAAGSHFWWGTTELPQVTEIRYLGVWLTHHWD